MPTDTQPGKAAPAPVSRVVSCAAPGRKCGPVIYHHRQLRPGENRGPRRGVRQVRNRRDGQAKNRPSQNQRTYRSVLTSLPGLRCCCSPAAGTAAAMLLAAVGLSCCLVFAMDICLRSERLCDP
jgi:hypothetical protein